ncbi:hypothetical protein CsSME_00042396 [Camellia sinensis var. sinensis]
MTGLLLKNLCVASSKGYLNCTDQMPWIYFHEMTRNFPKVGPGVSLYARNSFIHFGACVNSSAVTI